MDGSRRIPCILLYFCASIILKQVHVLLAFLITLIAVLYQIDGGSKYWEATESARFHVSHEKLFRFMTNPNQVPKWFLWAPGFRPADSRIIGVGKRFYVTYKIPFWGPHTIILTLTEYKPNEWIVLESDSFLKPKFTALLDPEDENKCIVRMSLEVRRTSALYRYTVAPIIWILTSQQLRHSLFTLRMIFPF